MNELTWPQSGRVNSVSKNAFILKQSEEGTPVAESCRKAGISQATHGNWKMR